MKTPTLESWVQNFGEFDSPFNKSFRTFKKEMEDLIDIRFLTLPIMTPKLT